MRNSLERLRPDHDKEWVVKWYALDASCIPTPDAFYDSAEKALQAVKATYSDRIAQNSDSAITLVFSCQMPVLPIRN